MGLHSTEIGTLLRDGEEKHKIRNDNSSTDLTSTATHCSAYKMVTVKSLHHYWIKAIQDVLQ